MIKNTIRRYFATDKIIWFLIFVVLILAFNESVDSGRHLTNDRFNLASDQSGAFISMSEKASPDSRTGNHPGATLLYNDGAPCNPVQTTKEIVSLQHTYIILTTLSDNSRTSAFPYLLCALIALIMLERRELYCIRRFTTIETSSDLDCLIYYIHHMNGLRR